MTGPTVAEAILASRPCPGPVSVSRRPARDALDAVRGAGEHAEVERLVWVDEDERQDEGVAS